MSKYKNFVVSLFLVLFLTVISIFNASTAFADVWVNGYTRSNGTYVQGHYRSSPDGNPYNNYSYPGNVNPYTGKTAPGNSSTYLDNYYNSSGSSYLGSPYSTPTYTSPYLYSGGYSVPNTKTIEGGSYIGSSLFCNSNYYKSGDSCVKAPENATALYTDFMCNSGYVKRGNQCFKPLNGYIKGSTIYCNEGYAVNSAKDDCISYDAWCLNSLGGINAGYDKSTAKCSCTGNTVYNGALCVDASFQCRQTYGLNSYGDKDYCYCSDGYEFNSTKTACIPIVTCTNGDLKVNDKCLSPDLACKSSYGEGAFSQGSLCYCASNYSWSKDLKSCELGDKTIVSKQLKVGTKGQDSIIVHNFLAQQKLYFGRVDAPISKETVKSIVQFQKNNKIESSGVIGPKTIQKINQLLNAN
jgi:hypothetical protein